MRVVPLVVATLLLVSAGAALAQERPIARVSTFAGEVFVRSSVTPPAGEWRRVTAVPIPLFTGDEIRTERGRAEVIYPNDDALRILENSNARITLSKERRSRFLFFGTREANLRAISTTAGRIWFNVRADRDNEVEFRSPVAVASVRGSIGQWSHFAERAMSELLVDVGSLLMRHQGLRSEIGPMRGGRASEGRIETFAHTGVPTPGVTEADIGRPVERAAEQPVREAPPIPVREPFSGLTGGEGGQVHAPVPVASPSE